MIGNKKISKGQLDLSGCLRNTTDTFNGVLTVNGDVKIRPDDKLILSDYSWINHQSVAPTNVTVANSLVYVSQSAEHYFLDDNGDLADVTANSVTANGILLTGDQDLSSFRLISDSYTKAEVDTLNALKANLNGNTLEIFKSANGVAGDDVVNKGQLDTKQDALTLDDSFYFDTEGVLRPNLSTYRQSINYVSGTQVFTLSFEPTFFTGIFINGQYLDESDYIYTSPNQLEILGTLESGDRIKIIYEKFVNQP